MIRGGNNSETAQREERRQIIARLRLRGLTQREIVDALHQQGRGVSIATVNRDLKVVHEQWRSHARQDIATHKARQLAELNELKRAAWQAKDYRLALSVLREEIALLGTDAPVKILWQQELKEQGVRTGDLFEQLVQMAEQELVKT